MTSQENLHDSLEDEREKASAQTQDLVQQICDKMTKDKTKTTNTKQVTHKIPWKIYVSRAMTGWGDRLWSFGCGVFMNLIAPENLRLVAIYGFATGISVIVFGAFIGSWIDKTSRLTAAKTFLIVQNFVTVLCCALLAAFFWVDVRTYWPDYVVTAVPIVTILLAVVANLASVGSRIAVEKDWIVVISAEDNDQLAKINSVFRTIDLLCLLVAPSLCGVIFDFLGNSWAAVFIALWNIVSLVIEYALLHLIYKEFAGLSHKKIDENPRPVEEQDNSLFAIPRTIWRSIVNSLQAWLCYMKHPARDAGLGLAFIYMTVLGFDNITYGYTLRQCVTESVLGALVGVSAIFGVVGSLTFPVLRRKVGLNKTGLIGTTAQIAMLSMCVISIWLEGSLFDINFYSTSNSNETSTFQDIDGTSEAPPPDDGSCYISSYASVGVFLAGVIAARFGLWISDLTINQVLQERVEEEKRGVLNGVQNGLNSSMDTLKFILVIALPDAETFGWLIMISFVFVCFGGISYTSYFLKSRPKNSKTVEA